MASSDSDFDVRFIYSHDRDWYLSVRAHFLPDTIEAGIESTPDGVIDCGGWDVRKALALMMKSNGAMLEWLGSPVVYAHSGCFWESARSLAPRIISPAALWHHYRGLRDASIKRFQGKNTAKVWLYALRPQLAMLWIERYLTMPPVSFAELSSGILPPGLRRSVAAALEAKLAKTEGETGFVPAPELQRFMDGELPRRPHLPCGPSNEDFAGTVDGLFRAVLAEQ